MRERVESGRGMLAGFGIIAAVSWWWHGHTSASSLWWTISFLLVGAGVIGFGRGVQLFLSGFSGFGRNFHEERDPPEESSAGDSDDQGVALNSETDGALVTPLVLLISGSIVAVFKVFPATNSFSWEFRDEPWVSPRVLVPWMFFVGFVVIAWSVLLRVMMKTGPDRWTYLPGTRDEIRKVTRTYVVWSVILIVVAASYMAASG
jgi:hypothetical protein